MSDWQRVTKRDPCCICGKPDWCTVTRDGAVACCMRSESCRQLGNGGWLHRLREGGDWNGGHVGRVTVVERRTPRDFGALAERHERAATDKMVAQLARCLGVSAESLRRLHTGYDGWAYTFPMRDGTGRIIGIRRRLPNGKKLCVTGSVTGLFVPDSVPADGALFVAEGETDTAALLTLGLSAVGRPSCNGSAAYVVQLARGRDVVMMADQDAPGKRGAIRLVRELRPVCPSVQIIIPPPGVKDVRAWVQAGATRSDIESTLDNGPIVRFGEHTDRANGLIYRETAEHDCPHRATFAGAGS
ncbi:MAG: toprim domain-containing protein [Phycisphaerales bacterium]|nr:MAG: toprim domain-containing protein [Phycisphaerales bacterium]